MKTRYKILIIICLSFIPISFFFPQVFLIFHLDKYETNEQCDKVNGEWDWIYDTCKLDYLDRALGRLQCKDIEALPRCEPCYPESAYSPWPRMLSFGCLDMCKEVCEFKSPSVVLKSGNEKYPIFKEGRYPKCYPDKIDPIHGVIVANDTHHFNPDTCQWEKGSLVVNSWK